MKTTMGMNYAFAMKYGTPLWGHSCDFTVIEAKRGTGGGKRDKWACKRGQNTATEEAGAWQKRWGVRVRSNRHRGRVDPTLELVVFWKRNIKLTRKGLKKAPGFREVVISLVLRKPRMDKTGDRFPVFVRDCGRQLGQQFWRCLKALSGAHAYINNNYSHSGWCFVYYNLPCLSYKPGGPAWISLTVTSTPRVPCTTSHVTLFFFFFNSSK